MLILIAAICCNTSEACAHSKHTKLDTLDTYRSKCGLSFRIYKKHWFGGSYSFVHEKLNHQDSMIFLRENHCYVRVYDTHNRLWFESATDNYGMVIGDVIFYYPNGTVERVKHFDDEMLLDACPDSTRISFEEPEQYGVWKYYRRDGSLKKQEQFGLEAIDCDSIDYRFYRKRIKYDHHGNVRSERTRRIAHWY